MDFFEADYYKHYSTNSVSINRNKTYFLSDAHLGASYIENPRAHEQRIVAMLRMMQTDARAVYLLGDMLDFWFEYRNVVPKGFTRFLGQVAALTDAGIKVYWFKGNHDMWTQGYLHNELGVEIIDNFIEQTIDGKKFVLSHGDGVGPIPQPFRSLRQFFRNETARRIGASLHPRWLMGFGLRWSAHNRASHYTGPARYKGDDREPQMIFAQEYSALHPDVDFYIMGHRHIATERKVPRSHAQFICLGDCYEQFTYAVFDGSDVQLKHFESTE